MSDHLGHERRSSWLPSGRAGGRPGRGGRITGANYGLREIAPAVSTGVVYLLAVLLVSSYWGLWLGVLTGLLSTATAAPGSKTWTCPPSSAARPSYA